MSGDRELVDAVLAGRRGAFERLVREHQGLVAKIAFRLVRRPEDAHDVCQEVFLRVHRQLHQFRHDGTLKAWIGRVAYSTALRSLERNPPIFEPLEADDGACLADTVEATLEQRQSERECAALIHAAVAALPAPYQLLISLYHLEQMSIADIAAVVGMPAGTIKNYLFRARRQLRASLESSLAEPL